MSAEEITSPTSEPGSEHKFGPSTLNPVIQATNHSIPAPSHRGRARSSAAVTDPSHSELQAHLDCRKVRFSSPLVPDPEHDMPDDNLVILVPNSSDPNLASRGDPEPSNHVPQSPSPPPPFPSPRLIFIRSHPHSLERTLGYRVSAVDSDVEDEPGKRDAFVPPITVSTQPKTIDDNVDVVSGGLEVNDGKRLERREEAENVDQYQFRANSSLGSQDPAETSRGNVQDYIEPQGAHPNGTTNVSESDMLHGVGIRQSPTASQPAHVPEKVETLKPMKSPKPCFDRPSRAESEARSKLQSEVEGDEEDHEAVDASKAMTNPNEPPHSTLFPPLGRMLSLLDEAGPPRSVGGFGRAITRRPRRPTGGHKFSKLIQTQPLAEVESGWQSEVTSNVNARSGAGASKSDDLGFFAGV